MTPAAARQRAIPGFSKHASERTRVHTMGKGTRSRNSRAGEVIADPSKFSKKSSADKSGLYTRIGVICCAVLLVACLLLWGATSLLPRIRTAARSEHYKVSGAEMTYFINSTKNTFISTYSSSGLSSYLKQLGLPSDTSLSNLKTSVCGIDKSKTKTWYDYFAEQTQTQVETILVLCEAARAEGMKLDDSEIATIKQNIKDMNKTFQEMASQYAAAGYSGYTASYLYTQECGNGVNDSNIRHAMELQALANKYRTAYIERIKDGITDEEIDKYVKDNPSKMLAADTLSYTFTAELELEDAEATDAEKEAYNKAKENAKKLAEELAACADKDAFVAKAVEYILGTFAEDKFDSYYATNTKSATVKDLPDEKTLAADKAAMIKAIADKVKGGTEDLKKYADDSNYNETYAKALDAVSASLLKDVQNAYDSMQKTSETSYSDPAAEDATDAAKWLFASDRKAGDKTVISSENDKKSTYTAYYLDAPAHLDETVTKNVGHILFKTATYDNDKTKAREKAEEILKKYKEGEMTKDAFEALAKEYNEDSNNFYENVTKDYMVEEFDAWIYDPERKVGDVDIVETSFGAHIMYFVGDGEVTWKLTAEDGLTNDKYTAWYDTAKESAGVSFNSGLISTLG